MGNRGQKRIETVEDLPPPADKRACNLQENRPSTSSSSSVQAQANSSGSVAEVNDHDDMDSSSDSEGEDLERDSSTYGSCESEQGRNELAEHQRQRSSADHDRFRTILPSLGQERDASEKLVLLTELCEVLSFCNEHSISTKTSDMLSPYLVQLARDEMIPDIVLLAIRAMTYLCDLFPASSGFLVRDNAVRVLCQKLMAIEDMDVAEQCLQALEKISRVQPLACFHGGAIMAVLSFLDFFSTSIQRVALSTVMNVCKKLPSETTSPFMDAVPILCNLLQYEDKKLVEIVAVCLIKITDRVRESPEKLDELCRSGLIQPTFHLLHSSNRATLPPMGFLSVLAKLCRGSFEAFKTLYELNISIVLKDILATADISHGVSSSNVVDGQCNQVYGVLKLLNVLVPSSTEDLKTSVPSEKEKFLLDQAQLLQNLARDILPLLIQVVNSGSNSYNCFIGLSIIKKLIHLCASDTLVGLLRNANISSFLAGVLTRRDPHILLLALVTAESVLQKLRTELLPFFVKEGVFFAIDALITADNCPPITSKTTASKSATPDSSSPQPPVDLHQKAAASSGVGRCLCFAFAPSGSTATPETKKCKVEKDSVSHLAKHIKSSYFPSALSDSVKMLSNTFRELRAFSLAISDMIDGDGVDKNDDRFYYILRDIITKLNGNEPVSTFEFVESGIVKSLVSYLFDSQNSCGDRGEGFTPEKSIHAFARLFLLSADPISQDLPMSTLVRKLQNGLSSLETFPVLLTSSGRTRETHTDIPSGGYTKSPCLRVRFVRDKGELSLLEYPKKHLTVNPLSTVEAIEKYLWPHVNSEAHKHDNQLEEKDADSDVIMTDVSEMREVAAVEILSASPKLSFFLGSKQLDRVSTLYQAVLQEQMKEDETVSIVKAWWNQGLTLTYTRAVNRPDDSHKLCSSSTHKSKNASLTDDIINLLKWLDCMNRCIFDLISKDKICEFAQGKINDLDELKIAVMPVPKIEFVNTKLSEKIEQQMRDTMATTVGGMPTWCNHLMSLSPFLFSFEARCKYFRLSAFGPLHARPHSDLERRQSLSSGGGSFPRKKFLVSRKNVLESATQMMELKDKHKVSLEVEYNEEVGTGLGPTLEFYTLVSHELQKCGMGMWRDDHGSLNASGFVTSPLGVFPRPWSNSTDVSMFSEISKKFVLLGQIVAKALQDGRVLDLHLSKAFYKLILGQELGLFDILSIDPGLGQTLIEFTALVNRKVYLESTNREISFFEYEPWYRGTRIEDLCLDFTLPGYPEILLCSNVEEETVTMRNLEDYVSLVLDATLRSGISRQLEAFKSGFNQVFPIEYLQIFAEEELERLLCGEHESWAVNELLDHVKFDHGYTASSPPIVNLLEIVREFDKNERRAFLQFVTGAPHLPLGGFASLNPKLTIVRKHCTVGPVDSDLPSVMTCANYLKLPPYSSKETMKEKLIYAITEGQGSFHLS